MKILYITPTSIIEVNGGTMNYRRGYDMCCSIAGKENVFSEFSLDQGAGRFTKQFRHLFYGLYYDMPPKKRNAIINLISQSNIDIVYLASSSLGKFAQVIKKKFPKVKVIVFFENLEVEYSKSIIATAPLKGKIIHSYNLILNKICERLSCKYADKIISLNSRDASAILNQYGRKPDFIAPICLKDEFNPDYLKEHKNTIPVGLMVGSNFPPNKSGLTWFIQNVLPHVNMDFIVVGSGMDRLKNEFKDVPRLEIHGFVEDLNEYYAKADFMVSPIFTGSGMKVKTAEALEFGKFIFAGPEAATGYEYSDKEIIVCHDANEYISAINSFSRPDNWNGFVQSSRDLFLNNYSYSKSLEIFNEVFKSLNL